MFFFLSLCAATFTAMAVIGTWCLHSPWKNTSLRGAWRWGKAAEFAWLLSSLITCLAPLNSPALDQLWLWTAVLTLCPLIAVLGARRPTTRVWSWFIICPLFAVLGWPGLTVLWHWPQMPPLRVQAPFCVGFALVTLMGVGNYMGTRFTMPAILAGLAAVMALAPLTTFVQFSGEATQAVRAAAGLIFSAAVFNALLQGRRPLLEENPFNRLWFDFQDSFGIVWSLRIQDRLNEIAEQEGWACRLGTDGFHWNLQTSAEARQNTTARMTHSLRWHLRRFVDPPWIDERLGDVPAASSTSASSGADAEMHSLLADQPQKNSIPE